MSEQQNRKEFDRTKYVEKKKWDIPDPTIPGTGIHVVIYYWDDPGEKTPRVSIRGYYSDKQTGEMRSEKGTKIRRGQLQTLIDVLTGVKNTLDQKYPNAQ